MAHANLSFTAEEMQCIASILLSAKNQIDHELKTNPVIHPQRLRFLECSRSAVDKFMAAAGKPETNMSPVIHRE